MNLDWKQRGKPGDGWNLVDLAGNTEIILDWIKYDQDTLVYRDSRGQRLGRSWSDATSALEGRFSGQSQDDKPAVQPAKRKARK